MERLEETLHEQRILVIDDEESNVLLLRRMLQREGYERVQTTTDPACAVQLFVEMCPALVLLDLHMPHLDGFAVMERLGPLAGGRGGVPFLVLTADATQETRRRALACGARDFLTKPFCQTELLLRVRNLLEVQQLHARLSEQNANLEEQVSQRTRDLEQARFEMLSRLTLAAEYRDDDTQEHAWRIGRSCRQLAAGLGLAGSQVELIGHAAPLHDIGKIGIPDAILLKPGKLTDAEFELVKTHTIIGAEILSGSQSPLLQLAEGIALTHHERWDGRGYPRQLCAEEIPLAGRIVAIADVFDALTHERPYKQAWTVDRAVAEILGQRAQQFDPYAIDVFASLDHRALLSPMRDQPLRIGPSRIRSHLSLSAVS